MFNRTAQLAGQPRLGAEVPEYADESIRELFEHPYRLVYRVVDESRVDVLAVVHAAHAHWALISVAGSKLGELVAAHFPIVLGQTPEAD